MNKFQETEFKMIQGETNQNQQSKGTKRKSVEFDELIHKKKTGGLEKDESDDLFEGRDRT